eukprot:gene13761-13880_t
MLAINGAYLQLPAADTRARQQLLQQLTAHPPDEQAWELGGNCNFMIAASRLGMHVGSVGHVGNDVYGQYMDRILQSEGIDATKRIMPAELEATDLNNTLLCFVLVDANGKHAFCSRYDFGPWPLLSGISSLPRAVLQALKSTEAVFTNGFVFDELPLELVKSAIQAASDAGAAVLFDPGPRASTMKTGVRRRALDTLMDLSDVVLMTEEEAFEVTGLSDPQSAAEAVLARPGARTQWCVVKRGASGALLATKSGEVYSAGSFKVDVSDTVGCGDSFAAAVVLGFVRSHDVHATLLLANAVGAATAMGRGAGTNVARAETVLSLLQAAAGNGSNGNEGTSRNGSQSSKVNLHDVNKALAMLQESLAGGRAVLASTSQQEAAATAA